MANMLSPPEEQPKLVEEQRNVPTSDAILGSLISRIPEQNPPSKQTCSLISDVFKDLAEAHQHYAAAAKNLAEVANLVSPEHLTIILAAAVQPNLQLVLPPGQVSPLFAHPTPTVSSTSDRKELIQLCKTAILPDPSHSVFHKVEERTPTRVLAAAVYCTLEKHLFDETTRRNDVASKFRITAAQLHKAITGIDYKSGPHKYKKRRKIDDVSTSHTQEPTAKYILKTSTNTTNETTFSRTCRPRRHVIFQQLRVPIRPSVKFMTSPIIMCYKTLLL